MAQAKAFADEQLKKAANQAKSGPAISKAAQALNDAEMGIEAKPDPKDDNPTKVLSISTESLVTDSDKANESTETESATTVMARQAAQSYV